MRKLLMLLVFCLSTTVLFAQQTKKENAKGDAANFEVNKEKKMDVLPGTMDQTKWIIESLDKYRKERSVGSQIQLLGVAVGGISFGFSDKPDDQRVLLIASGVIVFVGYFISANAVRHLSKKNLTFTGNGLALRF